jgi:uncharacterized OsmC-like protein
MTAKRKRKPDDPEQSKRFIEMAHEVEADADADTFKRAVDKVANTPAPTRAAKRTTSRER